VSHGNARTTFHGRLLIVQRHQAGMPKAHIAAAMGLSRKCVSTWIARFEVEGEAGLRDRSSRPRRCPHRTSAEVETAVLKLRQDERRGPDWIGPELGVPVRTVSRILRRHQVPYLRECDPITGEVIRSSKATAHRYERPQPGELVHMDVKKLGKIPDGGGWRALGRETTMAAKARRPRIGFDFVHSMVDDHSRLAYSEVHPDEKGHTVAGFLTRAAAYFARHGITEIKEVMTDNAWAYRHTAAVHDVVATLGARQVFIKPHCPWQNGKAERFNRTLQAEWAYRHPYPTNAARSAALAPWLDHYNTERRHSALGGLPPTTRLRPT
jgi:transposase InsO family protein